MVCPFVIIEFKLRPHILRKLLIKVVQNVLGSKIFDKAFFLVFHIGQFNKIVWHYSNGKGLVHDNILILNVYIAGKIR